MSTTYPTTPTPTPGPKQKKRWPYIAAIPVALFVGIGLGSANHGTTTPVAAPVTVTAPAAVSPYPMPSDARDNPTVPDPYTQAQPTGPLTTFGEGTYEVGTGDGQVAPGKYKSPGPGYYARLKSDDGELGSIIDNQLSEGQLLLTVKKTDKYIEVSRCTFTKV